MLVRVFDSSRYYRKGIILKKIRPYIIYIVFMALFGAPARRIVAQELATPFQVVQEVKSSDLTSSQSLTDETAITPDPPGPVEPDDFL